MNMHPRLEKTIPDRTDPGPGYDAPTRYCSLNYRTKLQKFGIIQFLRSLVVKVHKELEKLRLLFDDV